MTLSPQRILQVEPAWSDLGQSASRWWDAGAEPPRPHECGDPSGWPRITLVTPSFNQARFIEATIRSVLFQRYPNLEYIVIDGGSTDGTLDIIKKYEPWLSYWVSEPDKGPVDAIKKGFARATGEWFNWLNSDDFLLPGALHTLARISGTVPEARWIAGAHLNVTVEGLPAGVTVAWRADPTLIALGWGYFSQDATFVRRSFLTEHIDALREDIKALFDTVLYRELLLSERPCLTTAVFSAMRWYPEQITSRPSMRGQDDVHIQRCLERLPLSSRVALRAMRTRFQGSVSGLLRLAAYYGILPESRKWRACFFNRYKSRFEVHEARRWLLDHQ